MKETVEVRTSHTVAETESQYHQNIFFFMCAQAHTYLLYSCIGPLFPLQCVILFVVLLLVLNIFIVVIVFVT